MGNLHSTDRINFQTQPDVQLDEKNLVFLRKKKDARFGEINEFESIDTKEKILRKDFVIEDPSLRTDTQLSYLKNRVNLRHTNLLQIFGLSIVPEETGSAEAIKLSIYFEGFVTDSAHEFRTRRKGQNYFQDDELLGSLLYCLHVLQHLQSKEIAHGNLTPMSVFMGFDGEIKVADNSLLSEEHALYKLFLKGVRVPYIAPELLPLIKEKKEPSQTNYNPYKADVFSLGMVFLYAALLEEPVSCYNWDELTLEGHVLFDLFEKVREKYPGPFANLLHYLIKIEPKERPDFISLVQNVEYYKNTDFYVRDPRYGTRLPKSVISGTDFVTKHLKSSYLADIPSSANKISDSYTPLKRDWEPSASYSHRAYDKPLETVKSAIYQREEFLPPKSTYNDPSDSVTYNFVDPKVQAIIKQNKERSAQKLQASSPYTSKLYPPTTSVQQEITEPSNKYSHGYSPSVDYLPKTTSSYLASTGSIPITSNKLSETYKNPLSISGNYNPQPQYTAEGGSTKQFQPRFNNPFTDAEPVLNYLKKSGSFSINPPYSHREATMDKLGYTGSDPTEMRQIVSARDYGVSRYEIPESKPIVTSEPKPTEIISPRTNVSIEELYKKYGITAPKTIELLPKVEQTADIDNKLTFNSARVNDIIAQLRSQTFSTTQSKPETQFSENKTFSHQTPVIAVSTANLYSPITQRVTEAASPSVEKFDNVSKDLTAEFRSNNPYHEDKTLQVEKVEISQKQPVELPTQQEKLKEEYITVSALSIVESEKKEEKPNQEQVNVLAGKNPEDIIRELRQKYGKTPMKSDKVT